MQSITEILAQVIEDSDSFDELKTSAFESTGIYIDGLYCYHTGKLIGQFSRLEIEEAIFEEGGDDCDQEQLIDSLVVRVISSMRPSPALNKPDMGTIREMVARRPVDALAYLMNRFLHPLTLKRSFDESYSALRGRIEIYNWCSTLDTTQLSHFTHWLLALDSQFSLTRLEPPKGIRLPESIDEALKLIEAYALEKLAPESNIHRDGANSLTRAAYIRSFMDNQELAQRAINAKINEADRKRRQKTPKRVSKIQKQVDNFMGILESVLNSGETYAPVPVTPKKSRVVFGGQLVLRKKESN